MGKTSHTNLSADWVRGYRAAGASTSSLIDRTSHSSSGDHSDKFSPRKREASITTAWSNNVPKRMRRQRRKRTHGRCKLGPERNFRHLLVRNKLYRFTKTLSNMAVVSRVCSALFYASSMHAISCKTHGKKMISTSLPTF